MNKERYARLVMELGKDAIDAIDREESDQGEYEQDNGAFAFGAMSLDKQAALLCAIDCLLPTRNARPNYRTASSYGLKHLLERYLGFYVSNLQAKTAFHILGYRRSRYDLNPFYNISKREYDRLRLAAEIAASKRRA